MGSVWSKTLFDRRRAIFWWSLGFVLLTTAIVSIYPSVRDSPELDELTERLPAGLKALIGERSLTSPVGYVQSRLFQLMVPLLLLVFAIGQGSDAIAGEERRKTMDLLLANPISRRRIVVEKFLALGLQLVTLGVVLFVSLLLLTAIFDVALGALGLAAATTNAVLFALSFGAAALALGAATGRLGVSVGVATSVAAAAYVWESLAVIVPDLDGYAWASPFHHYVASDPLVQGFDPIYLIGFTAITTVLVVLASVLFSSRDIRI